MDFRHDEWVTAADNASTVGESWHRESGAVLLVAPTGTLLAALVTAIPGAIAGDGREVDVGSSAVSTVVLVGSSMPRGGANVDGLDRWMVPSEARRWLALAAAAEASHVVLISSAMVYGAWPNNAVPIPSVAALRPEPANGLAVACGEVERLVAQWSKEKTGRSVTVLRPTLVVHEGQKNWLRSTPWGGRGPALTDPEPPRQFLHLADLVAGVATAVDTEHDGVLDVAPDGWLAAERVRALAGPAPRLVVPGFVARAFQRRRWGGGLLVPFAGILPYLEHPWVVSNDALKTLGWVPAWTNEEAFVAASPAGTFTSMSPKRRQALSLGVAAGALAMVAGGLVMALRRSTKNR